MGRHECDGDCNLKMPHPRSYKKDEEPLLNLTGTMSSCSIEQVLQCTCNQSWAHHSYKLSEGAKAMSDL